MTDAQFVPYLIRGLAQIEHTSALFHDPTASALLFVAAVTQMELTSLTTVSLMTVPIQDHYIPRYVSQIEKLMSFLKLRIV